MADDDTIEARNLQAGDFSSWLSGIERVLSGDGESDVPCAGCTACCTSSQFVHVAPDETDTLAHIPRQLLFPAPGLPEGHVLLGYDEHGACPMLIDNRCSIYEHRPKACRTYDCRVLPAAAVDLDDDAKALLAERARRWRFSYPSDADRNRHDAVRAAARFLRANDDLFPDDAVPTNPTQLAVLAVEIHNVFLRVDDVAHQPVVIDPEPDDVRVVVMSRTRNERGRTDA